MTSMANSTAQHVRLKDCTQVSLYCPVQATVLGYYPNLGANAFLAAGFGVCLVALVVTGVWKRTWGYSASLGAGCVLELAGYIGRIQLHANPFNQSAFQLQICAIILAPTLLCIAIYVTLKHAVLSLNPALSRVPPRLYPLIFVPADVSCLILQAIGGGVAAVASGNNAALLLAGDRVIIAGIVLQVVVLGAFGAMSTDYLVRVRRWLAPPPPTSDDNDDDPVAQEQRDDARVLWRDARFRRFFYAVAGAYVCILIRCIYRIAEMSGGWGSTIMRDQPSFIVLEGFMILIPVVLLTFFPPGFLFPAMAERESQRFRRKGRVAQGAEDEKRPDTTTTTTGGVTSGDATPCLVESDLEKQRG